MKVELYRGDQMEVRVNIPSLKKARMYLLNLFAQDLARTHVLYNGRLYTSADIYARF